MMKASETITYLESMGFSADCITVHCGRWLDTVAIKPASGEMIARLKRRLPKLAAFIGTKSIVLSNNNDCTMLEITKPFIPLSDYEIATAGDELCLGLAWNDVPLTVDIRRGGLLVVGDPGTGKTILLEQCRERLQERFDIIDADNDYLSIFADHSASGEKIESETVLLADNIERLPENSQRDLLYIAIKSHITGILVMR